MGEIFVQSSRAKLWKLDSLSYTKGEAITILSITTVGTQGVLSRNRKKIERVRDPSKYQAE